MAWEGERRQPRRAAPQGGLPSPREGFAWGEGAPYRGAIIRPSGERRVRLVIAAAGEKAASREDAARKDGAPRPHHSG